MTSIQSKALLNIIDTTEALAREWNSPRRYRFPSLIKKESRLVLVNLHVAIDKGTFKWFAGIRLFHSKHKTLKRVGVWTPYERGALVGHLVKELEGVGDDSTENFFETAMGVHLERNLTEEEIRLIPQTTEDLETANTTLETEPLERII